MSAIACGQLIFQARHRANLRQADVAEWIGCSQKQISNYELGRRFPGVGVLCDIAYTLGMSHKETVAMLNALIGEGHLIRVRECGCDECRGLSPEGVR